MKKTKFLFRLLRRKCRSGHLRHNAQLERGLVGPIDDQRTCPGFLLGRGEMAACGCEIAAVYNGLLWQARAVPCARIIDAFEANGWLMGLLWGGRLGCDPFAIPEYLASLGVNTIKYKSFTDMNNDINRRNDGVYILSFWNRRPLRYGLHTVALRRVEGGLHVRNAAGPGLVTELGKITDERRFICGCRLDGSFPRNGL